MQSSNHYLNYDHITKVGAIVSDLHGLVDLLPHSMIQIMPIFGYISKDRYWKIHRHNSYDPIWVIYNTTDHAVIGTHFN